MTIGSSDDTASERGRLNRSSGGNVGLGWPRLVSRLAWVVAIAMILAYLAPVLYHLTRGSDLYLTLPADDFWYYAFTAVTNAVHNHLSFDGRTMTNGFHPLWMITLTLLAEASMGWSDTYFLLITIVTACAALTTFALYLKIARRLFPDSPFTAPAALIAALFSTMMMAWWMEVVLALPLYALLLLALIDLDSLPKITARRALMLGLISSALVLARLDAVIIPGMIVLGWLLMRKRLPSVGIGELIAFGAGLLPIVLYLEWNRIVFGHFLPVSALAKQSGEALIFNGRIFAEVWALDSGKAGFVLGGVGLALLLSKKVGLGGTRRLAAIIALLFPIVFFTTYALRSEWMLFKWYLYPMPMAMLLGLIVIGETLRSRVSPKSLRAASIGAAAAVMFAALYVSISYALDVTIDYRPDPNGVYSHAKELRRFVATHPGRYAMGDRAGLTAVILRTPILQLEGLMADLELVEHIRNRSDLRAVLRLFQYRTDYLIVSVYEPLERVNGCRAVTIPSPVQAGPNAPAMTGRFCEEPVFTYSTGRCFTYVFTLNDSLR